MSGFIFNSNQIPVMQVPRSVVDRYLSSATGAQVKVILCLIRYEQMPLTAADIAKQCGIDEGEVGPAIDFWVKNGLVIRRGASLILSNTATEQPQTLPRYNPDSILERKESDGEFSHLIDEVQRVVGKSLNHNDASVVFAMYDHLGFTSELVLQIINYCIGMGKTNFRYIETVALDWYDRGIDSFEKAEAHIRSLEKRARFETAVSTYFGIDGRALSKKEREYIKTWTAAFGMSLEMIKEAYERCIDNKGKLSFAYINGILTDWHKNGYKTIADVSGDKRPSADTKSFDSGDIEKEILKRLTGEIK